MIPGWQNLLWPSQLRSRAGELLGGGEMRCVPEMLHLDTVSGAFGALLWPMSQEEVAQHALRVHLAQTGLSRKKQQKIPAGKRQSRQWMCSKFSTPFSSAGLKGVCAHFTDSWVTLNLWSEDEKCKIAASLFHYLGL